MKQPTPEQIARLPKWARDHIADLERTAADTQREIRGILDNQTESKIFSDVYIEGNFEKVYYNVSEQIHIHHAGVFLKVNFRAEDRIELQWSTHEFGLGDVCLIPTSYQQARLVHPKNAYVR